MKFGMRKPSLKKSIKARTTGKAKRAIKKAVIPGYGKSYNSGNSYNKSSSSMQNKAEILAQAQVLGLKIGVDNNIIKKANKYAGIALILVLLGFAIPVLLLPGIIMIIISFKIILSKEYKAQNIWQKALVDYINGMYDKAQAEINKLAEDEKNKREYKIFNKLVNDALNPDGEVSVNYSFEAFDEFIAIDVETTGLDRKLDRIIEVSAVKFKDGEIVDEFEELVNPGIHIPEAASSINNITDDMVQGKPEIDEVLERLLTFIGDKPLVAHNAPFDMEFIDFDLSLCGKHLQNKVIDTLKISRKIYPDLENHKLVTIKEYLNIDGVSHRAKSDAAVCGKIYADYCKLKKEAEEQFDEEEKRYFLVVKDFLISRGKDVSYLKMRHAGVYTDICMFNTLVRFKIGGKKRYILTNIEDEVLVRKGVEVEEPSKSEKFKNRIGLEWFEKMDILEDYLLEEYDNGMAEAQRCANGNRNARKSLDEYLMS